MRKIKKYLQFLLFLNLSFCVFLFGCVKNDKLYSPQQGNIYMPQAYADRGTLSLSVSDTPQVAYFGAAFSGFNSAPQTIAATFQVDTSLISQYNIDNAYLGNTYYALPKSSYTIDSLTTMIQPGSRTSIPLSLSIVTSKLNSSIHYILPIKLTSVSVGKIDSSLSVTYFLINSLSD